MPPPTWSLAVPPWCSPPMWPASWPQEPVCHFRLSRQSPSRRRWPPPGRSRRRRSGCPPGGSASYHALITGSWLPVRPGPGHWQRSASGARPGWWSSTWGSWLRQRPAPATPSWSSKRRTRSCSASCKRCYHKCEQVILNLANSHPDD